MEYLKKVRENQALPSINLYNDFEFKFNNKQNITEINSDDRESLYPSYRNMKIVLGLEIKFPVGNHKASGDLREIELNKINFIVIIL